MVPPLFLSAIFLISFCIWGCAGAALVNHTIEDFSPLMQYNCTKTLQRCDANATIGNSNPCRLPGPEAGDRTFGYTHEPCEITVPFAGTAVYAFIACEPCQFEIDNSGVQGSIPGSQDSGLVGLSYFNNTLPFGAHTLVITSPSDMLMDYVLYTVNDSAATIPPAAPRPSSSNVAGGKSSLPIGAIVGSLLGAVVLGAAFSAIVFIFLQRRARAAEVHRNKTSRIFVWPWTPPSSRSFKSDAEAGSASQEQYNNSGLHPQMAEMRETLGVYGPGMNAQRAASGKREQMVTVVRDHGPGARQEDSGLTPAGWMEQLPPEYAEN
ncbi:hypothetical protein B0H19DRAFT_1370986 [Mycena capillaripes]|nr:hypothetical protein B0H19DRAFT_1370986 [Mycena capillaripes]